MHPVAVVGANGFPGGAYAAVHAALRARGLASRSHDCFSRMLPSIDAGRRDWRAMRDDIICSVEAQLEGEKGGPTGRIHAIGHSFGGAILCCAAARRPDLFGTLVIVDPPMFRRLPRVAAFLASVLGVDARYWHPFVRGAMRRTRAWPSRDAARRHLSARYPFKKMHPDSLDAFVDHALCSSSAGGVQLLFSPEAEAAIFVTFPPDLPLVQSAETLLGQYDLDKAFPARHSAGWLLYSSEYPMLTRADIAYLRRRLTSLAFRGFPHGHFWPLEDPAGFSSVVADLLEHAEVPQASQEGGGVR